MLYSEIRWLSIRWLSVGLLQRRNMDVGRRVRELREARGLTQRELARRASLTPMGVSRIERAGNKSSALSIDRLARALNVDPGELFKDPTRPKVVTLPSTPVT